MSELAKWESFYIIVGSSAGALTGLQFVVIALVSERRRTANLTDINAFGTPTIVHFCCVLLLAAILSAPWVGLGPVAAGLGLLGAGGLAYMVIVARRAGRGEYKPVFEDVLWHLVLPVIAYIAMLVAAMPLSRGATGVLFAVGAAALLLLFAGIRNAWDTVTFIVSTSDRGQRGSTGVDGEGKAV